MPNTEQSILDNGIPEISMELSPSSVTTQPTDPNLENEGQPADAAAVGARFDEVDDDIADLGADLSSLSDSVDSRFDTVDAKTGASIPVNTALDAPSISEAIAAVESAMNAKTGSDIPITGETGASTIAGAIAAVNAKTGASIPINEVTGAMSIEDAMNAKNGSNIPLTGETGASSIASAIGTLQAGLGSAVKKVDNLTPDQSGNVVLTETYPQRKTISVTISAGVTTSIVNNAWITADTDCYAHTLAYLNVPTGISWEFEAGKVTFTLDEALSEALVFTFGMIKGGVNLT